MGVDAKAPANVTGVICLTSSPFSCRLRNFRLGAGDVFGGAEMEGLVEKKSAVRDLGGVALG